jgi:hypothetical protein
MAEACLLASLAIIYVRARRHSFLVTTPSQQLLLTARHRAGILMLCTWGESVVVRNIQGVYLTGWLAVRQISSATRVFKWRLLQSPSRRHST